jgi:DNA-binding CsgD family transcriptional regulator
MNTFPLTACEQEVVRLLVEGYTPQEIDGLLGLSPKTVSKRLYRMRVRVGARNNEQMILMLAWHHPKTLVGAMVKHGTAQALDWHEDTEVPLCEPCKNLMKARERTEKVPRKTSEPTPGGRGPYRRLTAVGDHAKRGQPVKHGTMQAARRHLAAKERINDLTCGCREAYREWWQEYERERRALGA